MPASGDAAPGERGAHRFLLVAVTVLAFSVLYAPQPLLPLFARRFGVSEPAAALLITATLLPLSFAPLSYGYLLQKISPVRLLRIGVVCLGALELLFAAADRFALLLGVRFLQGLLLPAVITSLMTYIALAAPPERRSRDLARYVGASIVGGYLGRLLSGLGAAYTDWRLVFILLGAGLLLAAIPLGRLRPVRGPDAAAPPSLRLVGEVLREGAYTRLYVTVFAFFFVFAALLNFLPFRLEEIAPDSADLWRGLVYTGYLFGVAAALGSGRISRWLGGPARTLTTAFGVYTAALACTLVADPWALFAVLFVFCGAMILMHAVATGEVNRGGGERAGIVNGLYLVFYYGGGVLGSFLPGIAYERFGWTAFVGVLLGVAVVGWGAAASLLLRRPAAEPTAVPAETGTGG